MGKIKKESGSDEMETSNVPAKEESEDVPYEEKVKNTCVIAKPMASKKLSKKCYKLLKKGLYIIFFVYIVKSLKRRCLLASKHKTFVRNGLKDVQKRIRKGESGILIYAGDISPVDIMVHLPGICEDKDIPYCYVPSRMDLGAALGMKRGSLMALVKEKDDYQDLYNELKEEISHLAVEL